MKTNRRQRNVHKMFEIKDIKVNTPDIKQCPAAQCGVLMKHPFFSYVCGRSRSGKTVFMLNLLTDQKFYKGYFDNIFVLSPTANHLDPKYRVLDIPPENFFLPDVRVLDRIFEIQENADDIDAEKNLIILDDIASYKKFCHSPQIRKLAVMGRHHRLSCFCLSQRYMLLDVTLRCNITNLIYYQGNTNETMTIAREFCPPGWSYAQFRKAIEYVTKKKFSFLFIDKERDLDDTFGRYRQNLTHTIKIQRNNSR